MDGEEEAEPAIGDGGGGGGRCWVIVTFHTLLPSLA